MDLEGCFGTQILQIELTGGEGVIDQFRVLTVSILS